MNVIDKSAVDAGVKATASLQKLRFYPSRNRCVLGIGTDFILADQTFSLTAEVVDRRNNAFAYSHLGASVMREWPDSDLFEGSKPGLGSG